MRWLLILVTVFVMSCVTVPVANVKSDKKPIATSGWVSMNEKGTNWQLRGKNFEDKLVVIGRCMRTAYSLERKYETWIGTYFPGYTSFDGPEPFYKRSGSLAECVEFIERHTYGAYYI